MNAGSATWRIFLFTHRERFQTAPWSRWRKSFTCLPDLIRTQERNDTESRAGRGVSLVGRFSIRQFLRSLSRGQAVVVGNLLAGRRILQLDHRSLGAGSAPDQRPESCTLIGLRRP